MAEPDGYSKDVVEEISKEYPALENKDSEDDPTIIVIMNGVLCGFECDFPLWI